MERSTSQRPLFFVAFEMSGPSAGGTERGLRTQSAGNEGMVFGGSCRTPNTGEPRTAGAEFGPVNLLLSIIGKIGLAILWCVIL